MTAFERLAALVRERELAGSAASVLGWDQETCLPPAAADWRACQLAWLSARAHEMGTSGRFRAALEAAESENSGDDPVRNSDLRELRHHFDRATKLSVELVARASEAASRAKVAWVEARRRSDFTLFAAHLRAIVGICREKADLWGYRDEPYDALLEEYERGADTAKLTSLLDPLRRPLRELAAEAVGRAAGRPARLPAGPYPVDAQQVLNREIAESIGFDFSAGRIDTAAHPFCAGLGPGDTRLTTRYDEADFTSSLFGILHEAGHGLYDQGLPGERRHLPSGSDVSLGIHESQSRLWENHVGGSREFWRRWLPRAAELFPCLRRLDPGDFLAALRRAEYSCIRVEADEATYDLHILLRLDLERRLIRGELDTGDVPAAWNEGFRELFGFAPPDDARGCLQDIHWAMGAIGYFATYTLGNLNAAQLFAAARRDPGVAAGLASAEYLPLLGWLRQNIHRHGSVLLPDELITRATGQAPDPGPYLEHLRERYC